MDLDRQRLERCLEQVVAYRAPGLKATAWADHTSFDLLSGRQHRLHCQRVRGLDLDLVAPEVPGCA